MSDAYPNARFLWVDILQRLHWIVSYEGNIIIERKRQQCKDGTFISQELDIQKLIRSDHKNCNCLSATNTKGLGESLHHIQQAKQTRQTLKEHLCQIKLKKHR